MDESLRLIPSPCGFLWFPCDQLTVGWQMGVVTIQMDTTIQAWPAFIVEGDHISIHSIREAVELGNLQGFWPQPNDGALRFHNFYMDGKDLHVCLCLCESDVKEKQTFTDK